MPIQRDRRPSFSSVASALCCVLQVTARDLARCLEPFRLKNSVPYPIASGENCVRAFTFFSIELRFP
jgi:hypothetical protein